MAFADVIFNEYVPSITRGSTVVRLSGKEWRLFKPLWDAREIGHIDRIALNKLAYPLCVSEDTADWRYASAKVILCKLRKKLVKVGLRIETKRVGHGITYIARGYRLIDVAAMPPVFPKAEQTTTEEKAA